MSQSYAAELIKEFRHQGIPVPKLEISSVGGLAFVAAYDEEPTTVMVNEAAAGMDFSPDVAACKALVEYLERKVFLEGVGQNNPICARAHSDGMAAYPRRISGSHLRARENAYSEALERFVWATWWDNTSVGHSAKEFSQTEFSTNVKITEAYQALRQIIAVDSLIVIEPQCSERRHDTIILFAKIPGRGYISGGAAGPKSERSATFTRALAELIRHGIALSRFLKVGVEAKTFYESRLVYFGMGHGNAIVENRLKKDDGYSIVLPDLEIDQELKSQKYDDIIVAYRCLFENQPPFVDGALERLCL